MTDSKTPFSVREFLHEREALLVHFSTPMTRHEDLLFPYDLQKAMQLTDVPLSFSTIQSQDRGPYHPGVTFEEANAVGSVGIIVDIQDDDCVLTVGQSDDGTFYDTKSGEWVSGGSPPTADACTHSIDKRKGANEWFVKNYVPIGIFLFSPVHVRQACKIGTDTVYAEGEVGIANVIEHFPCLRVFTVCSGVFQELDRDTGQWMPVSYGDILRTG